MPAYSFQKRFVPPVERGDKTHTIRGKRKARPKPGQRFVAYYGMRTKQCRKLLESVITRVQDIEIRMVKVTDSYSTWRVFIDGEMLDTSEMKALAVRDGFDSLAEMQKFWPAESLPFSGDLIHWKRVQA